MQRDIICCGIVVHPCFGPSLKPHLPSHDFLPHNPLTLLTLPSPGSWLLEPASFFQLTEFVALSVPEVAGICASLELLTDLHALGRIGMRAEEWFVCAPARTFPGASIWSQEHTVTVHGASAERLSPWASATASRWRPRAPRRSGTHCTSLQHTPLNQLRP